MEFLQDKWYLLVIIFCYLALFLPAIALSIVTLIIYGTPFLFLIMPEKFIIKIIDKLGTIPKEDMINIGFKYGFFVRKLRDDLNGYIPKIFLKRIIVFPIQKYILDYSIKFYDSLSQAFLEGFKKVPHNGEEIITEKKYSKGSFILGIILMFLIISCPILVLLALVVFLFM